MPKYNTLDEYVHTFNEEAKNFYDHIVKLTKKWDESIQVRLFAGQVAFYKESTLKHTFHASPVIVMAFFSSYVNIFASGNALLKDCEGISLTEKKTLKYPYKLPIDQDIFYRLFMHSLHETDYV